MSNKKTTKKEVLEIIRSIYEGERKNKDRSYVIINLNDEYLLEAWHWVPGMILEIHIKSGYRGRFSKSIVKSIPKSMKWIKENIGYEETKLKLEEHILTNI
jgi:hypothetical protein